VDLFLAQLPIQLITARPGLVNHARFAYELLDPAEQFSITALTRNQLELALGQSRRTVVVRDHPLVRGVIDPDPVDTIRHDPFLLYVALHPPLGV